MLFNFFHLLLVLSFSNKIAKGLSLRQDCSKPDGFNDIIDNEGPYEKTKLYACGQDFTNQIIIKNSILTIMHCNFRDVSLENSVFGIIKINIDNFPADLTGNIEILDTKFKTCNGGCIYYISTDSSKTIDITNCIFDSCQADKGGITISCQASSGNIDNCQFIKNRISGFNGCTVYYAPPDSQTYSGKLTVTNCKFEFDDKYDSNSFIQFSRDNLFLEFSNNQLKISENSEYIKVFNMDNNGRLSQFQGWTLENNCMNPLRKEIIFGQDEADLTQIIDKFEECPPMQCPPIPDPNSNLYIISCDTEFEGSSKAIIDSLVSFYYCTFLRFYKSTETVFGGAMYISTSSKINKDVNLPIRIYNCDFSECQADKGGAIFITSSEVGRLFDIKDCTFLNNRVSTDGFGDDSFGGAIYINAKYCSVLISGSSFENNEAGVGGCICFVTDSESASSSKTLLEGDVEYSLRITGCDFNKNIGVGDGGAISILLENGDVEKPIEIVECIFNGNYADEFDFTQDFDEEFLPESGGVIYFIYNPSTTPSTNFALHINKCKFKQNHCGSKGGAICLLVIDKEPLNPIEINNCIFNTNKALSDFQSPTADGYGSDIYYSYKASSTSSSKKILETNPSLLVYECEFSNGFANVTGGSIYLSVQDVEVSRPIEITKCIFKESSSLEGGAVDIYSNKPVLFQISECEFVGKCSLFFNAVSGLVSKCNFTDMKELSAIRYDCFESESSSSEITFKVDGCNFVQKNEITSLVFFVPKASSNFEFSSNIINISNNATCVFDCASGVQLAGTWKFTNNAISPAEEKYLNTENAKSIQFEASCTNGFDCKATLPEQVCDGTDRCIGNGNENQISSVFITETSFSKLKNDPNGGAVELINYGIIANNTQFEYCNATQGGGAIYIYIDKELPEQQVYLNDLEFTGNQAVYGGGVFIYCNQESVKVQIVSCKFNNNVASKEVTPDHLYGGAALYLKTKNGVVISCRFSKNVGIGVKIFNDFPETSTKSIQSMKSSLSFENCFFEMNYESSSSLYYVHMNKENADVNVKDCVFTGKLNKNAYYIDGVSLSQKVDSPKINIESCKFSTDEKTAMNLNPKLVKFDAKSQQFNFNGSKNDNKKNSRDSLILISVASMTLAVAVLVIAIVKMKKTTNENEDSEEKNESDMI